MTAPLVRARVVEYLAQRVVPGVRRWNGQIPTSADTQAMAHDLGISPHDVNETLWMLQKQQIVTFKERKGAKGSVISRIRIADTALNGAPVETIRNVVLTDDEIIDEAIDTVLVAREMEMSGPGKALADLLTRMGRPMRVFDANVNLGYARGSTALYSITKHNPDMFAIEKGEIRLLGPTTPPEAVQTYAHTPCTNRKAAPEWCVAHDSVWHRGDMFCEAEWFRRNPGPVTETEAGADAQNDASTAPAEVVVADDLPAILVPPPLADYPAIAKVLRERRQRDVTADAAQRLSEAGLDDYAIPLMEAWPPMTALETEVVILATLLGWLDG